MSNLIAFLKEHHAELHVKALSAQYSRDRATKGKNVVDSNDAPTSTNNSHCHQPENIKEVLLASIKHTTNSS